MVGEAFDLSVDDLNMFNVVAFLVAVFSPIALMAFGYQEGSQAVFMTGVFFIVLAVVGVVLSGFGLLAGQANMRESSFSFWVLVLVFTVPGAVLGRELSMFSLPTAEGAYLSVLAGTEPYVEATANIIAAPFGETFLFLGLAILLGLVVVTRTDLNPVLVLSGLALALGVVFSRLHGVRGLAFSAVATLFMAVTIFVVVGHAKDLLPFESRIVAVTLGAAIGAHLGNNVAASGGWMPVMEAFWAAPDPYINIAYLWTGFLVVTALYALAEVVVLASGARSRIGG